MLFFIIYCLFISISIFNYTTATLRCFGNKFPLTSCEFKLKIKDSFPSDQQILSLFNCEMNNANSILIANGYCFAQIAIDYHSNTMNIVLTDADAIKLILTPYLEMLNLNPTVDQVIRYKIAGQMRTKTMILTTRILCKISDNCALTELRRLLPQLILTKDKMANFNALINLLNDPLPTSGTTLKCMDDNNQPEDCNEIEPRCTIEYSEKVMWKKEQQCIAFDSTHAEDFSYQFNIVAGVIAVLIPSHTDMSVQYYYECTKANCNSEENLQKVAELARNIALTTETKDPSGSGPSHVPPQKPANNSALPQQNPSKKPSKSAGVPSAATCSNILFLCFIQILFI